MFCRIDALQGTLQNWSCGRIRSEHLEMSPVELAAWQYSYNSEQGVSAHLSTNVPGSKESAGQALHPWERNLTRKQFGTWMCCTRRVNYESGGNGFLREQHWSQAHKRLRPTSAYRKPLGVGRSQHLIVESQVLLKPHKLSVGFLQTHEIVPHRKVLLFSVY